MDVVRRRRRLRMPSGLRGAGGVGGGLLADACGGVCKD